MLLSASCRVEKEKKENKDKKRKEEKSKSASFGLGAMFEMDSLVDESNSSLDYSDEDFIVPHKKKRGWEINFLAFAKKQNYVSIFNSR